MKPGFNFDTSSEEMTIYNIAEFLVILSPVRFIMFSVLKEMQNKLYIVVSAVTRTLILFQNWFPHICWEMMTKEFYLGSIH